VKLNIVTDESDKLELEVGGEGHSLLNLLQSSILAHNDVNMAGYTKPHPLMDRSTLFVTVKRGKDPRKALIEAAGDAKEKLAEFMKKFDDEVSKKRG